MPAERPGISKRKKRVLAVSGAVLALLLVCTFLSRTISALYLPTVRTAEAAGGSLSYTADCVGVVDYPGAQVIRAKGEWTLTELPVREDQRLLADKPLFTVDMDAANVQIGQQELTVSQQEDRVKAAETARERALAQQQLELERQKLSMLKGRYPENGQAFTDQICRIVKVTAKVGQPLMEGDEILRLVPAEEMPSVTWKMDVNAGASYQEGTTVRVSYLSYDPLERETKSQEIQTTVKEKTFQVETNTYRFTAALDRSVDLPLGRSVNVRITESSASYECLIPVSGLLPHDSQSESKGYVYVVQKTQGIFGEQRTVVRTEVDVQSKNSLYAAVRGNGLYPGSTVVANVTSGALQNGAQVKVENGYDGE